MTSKEINKMISSSEKASSSILQEVNALNQESWNNRRNDCPFSKKMAELALSLSQYAHYDLGIAEAYLNLGICEGYQGSLNDAIVLTEKAILIFERLDYHLGIIRACNVFGYIYIVRNELGKAFEYMLRGIQLSKTHHIDEMLIFFYYNIGEIYKNTLSLYQDALCYLLQALPLTEANPQHPLCAAIFASIGACYQKLGQLDKGMHYVSMAYHRSEQLTDKQTLNICLQLLASIHKDLGDYKKAKYYIQRQFKLLDTLNDPYAEAHAQLTSAMVLYAENFFEESIEYSRQGLLIVDKNNFAALTYHFYLILAQCYEALTNYEQASIYYKKYIIAYEKTLTLEVENRIVVNSAELKLEEQFKELKLRMHNEKMAALADIVTGVAHEINTPLGNAISIASFLDDLEKELAENHHSNQLSPTQLNEFLESTQESIAMLQQSLRRTANIVDSFKDVAMNRHALDLKTFNIYTLITELEIMLYPDLQSQHVRLDVDCPSRLIISSYEELIRYVIMHLIQNALLHAFDNIDSPLIRVSVIAEPRFLHLSVYDNGIGIPKAHIDKIYNPFFTTKKANGGIGLGLNIVYNMVTELMNGTIEVHSESNNGTTFDLYIPKESH